MTGRAFIALGLGALALAVCNKDEGPNIGQSSGDPAAQGATSDSSSTGVAPPPCGELGEAFTDADCGTCARGACCAELSACDDNETCTSLLDCRAMCFDSGCVDSCTASHSGGVSDVAELDACMMGKCAEECPAPVGVCDTDLTLGDEACDSCLGRNCCKVLQDCVASRNCKACVTTGDGVDCGQDAEFEAVDACFSESCGDVCDA